MTRLGLLMVVAVADGGSGTSSRWRVTFSSSLGVDHGDGRIAGTEDTQVVVTPTELLRVSVATHEGKKTSLAEKPQKVSDATREAIAALLPSLPSQPSTFSISPSVNDEGWYHERLTIERDGKTIVFQLVQGNRAPPLPASLSKLKELVGRSGP